MTPTVFSTFKYQHTGRVVRSPKRLRFVYVSLGMTLLAVIFLHRGWLVLLWVPLIAWSSVSRQLLLGPRYLLCGEDIVYYANVKQLTLTTAQGELRLVSANGKSFVLERDKFPTNARKADKISRNKSAKFDKVSAKIIDKVRSAAVDVELRGV
jgi:hypothetical protein